MASANANNPAVFGKGKGQCPGEFEFAEVVTVCDHLSLLDRIEMKHEIVRKPRRIAFNHLIERLGEHTVELGQVCIHHHAQATNHLDSAIDAWHHGVRWGTENYFGQNVLLRVLCNWLVCY